MEDIWSPRPPNADALCMLAIAVLALPNVLGCTYFSCLPVASWERISIATAAFMPSVSLRGKGPIGGPMESSPTSSAYPSTRIASERLPFTVVGSNAQKASREHLRNFRRVRRCLVTRMLGSFEKMFRKWHVSH